MKLFLRYSYLLFLIPLLYGSTCLTVDPPYPARLSAPIIAGHEIISRKLDSELRETIHIQWLSDTTDTISINRFTVLRKTTQDSSWTPIYNIPTIVRDIYDPVYLLNLEDRSVTHTILYAIYAIDSLERSGDTSLIYSVDLAQSVELSTPTDTLTSNIFSWAIPQIVNRTFCFMNLWKNDSLLWTSDTIKEYTGGIPLNVSRSLPDTYFPLQSGTYFWGVTLIIINGASTIEPSSITLRAFYTE